MILTLYLALLALATIVVALGLVLHEPYFTFVGLFFFFSLGLLLFAGELEYKIGTNSSTCGFEDIYVYGNNYTGYHWDYDVDDAPNCANPNDFNCVRLFHRERVPDPDCVIVEYDLYESLGKSAAFWYGFLLALSAGFGMFALFWNLRASFKKWDDIEKGEGP